MAAKATSSSTIIIVAAFIAALITGTNITTVVSDDTAPVPGDKSQLNKWFKENVKPLSTQLRRRRTMIQPSVAEAEKRVRMVKVMKDGSGDFRTVTAAINSIPEGNRRRVIVYIGSGTYYEKIKIEKTKPFVTLYGDPQKWPNLTFHGTAQRFGTVDSASLIVESDYFVAVNLIISNSAPMPNGKIARPQAVALRISGNYAAFYRCAMLGYQDTICDDRGKHFFKDCYIQGTMDFIFGSGKSLYLNARLKVVGRNGGVIAAPARTNQSDDTCGYSFVHCDISGTANGTYLGRAWMSHPKVVYAYTSMSSIVNPLGWDDSPQGAPNTVYYGEYKNKGVGARRTGRANFTKWLRRSEALPFITLSYIEASKWLLPPPTLP
ncbi:putative pectinesterase 63 [Prosopis cineraria]|uniref:putative pectinesterase 63 n=1 Tax=Prosopis cineraria TaxID=364024 RepID=UPI00240F0214|nr:putative pectinesterase 63 [Prosopis cineraria]